MSLQHLLELAFALNRLDDFDALFQAPRASSLAELEAAEKRPARKPRPDMKKLEVRLTQEPGQERVVGQLAETGPRPASRQIVLRVRSGLPARSSVAVSLQAAAAAGPHRAPRSRLRPDLRSVRRLVAGRVGSAAHGPVLPAARIGPRRGVGAGSAGLSRNQDHGSAHLSSSGRSRGPPGAASSTCTRWPALPSR